MNNYLLRKYNNYKEKRNINRNIYHNIYHNDKDCLMQSRITSIQHIKLHCQTRHKLLVRCRKYRN
jgi:ribosomal protein L19E